MLVFIQQLAWGVAGCVAFFMILNFALIFFCFRKVPMGQAIVRNGVGGMHVGFSGKLVLPGMHTYEFMDITQKRIVIDFSDEHTLTCRDDIGVEAKIAFFVRVNNTVEDVIKVAQTLGCERASDMQALNELFNVKFSEAVKAVVDGHDFAILHDSHAIFREQVLHALGTNFDGFVLEEITIDYFESTEDIKCYG